MTFGVRPRTFYSVHCWRAGRLLWVDGFENLVTMAGRTQLLEAAFRSGKAANAWCVGLVNSAGFTAYSSADTMATHGGWVESVDYDETTRRPYLPAVAAGASISNTASRAIFTMNTHLTIQGAFLADENTKAGVTGTLYGVGSLSTTYEVVSGDILRISLTLTD